MPCTLSKLRLSKPEKKSVNHEENEALRSKICCSQMNSEHVMQETTCVAAKPRSTDFNAEGGIVFVFLESELWRRAIQRDACLGEDAPNFAFILRQIEKPRKAHCLNSAASTRPPTHQSQKKIPRTTIWKQNYGL